MLARGIRGGHERAWTPPPVPHMRPDARTCVRSRQLGVTNPAARGRISLAEPAMDVRATPHDTERLSRRLRCERGIGPGRAAHGAADAGRRAARHLRALQRGREEPAGDGQPCARPDPAAERHGAHLARDAPGDQHHARLLPDPRRHHVGAAQRRHRVRAAPCALRLLLRHLQPLGGARPAAPSAPGRCR